MVRRVPDEARGRAPGRSDEDEDVAIRWRIAVLKTVSIRSCRDLIISVVTRGHSIRVHHLLSTVRLMMKKMMMMMMMMMMWGENQL
jgi:hypothetical protein